MANKDLARRQKMAFRVEPSQKSLKPRNPVAIAAKQRAAGPHKKSSSAQRRLLNQLLKKRLDDSEQH
jgi:hypothetical protein